MPFDYLIKPPCSSAKEIKDTNNELINQLKNISQSEEPQVNMDNKKIEDINSFNDLIKVCAKKKEMSLKFEFSLKTYPKLLRFCLSYYYLLLFYQLFGNHLIHLGAYFLLS